MLKRIFRTGLRFLWVSFLVILIDRYSKNWILSHLSYLERVKIFPFFNLTHVYNTGAAFSFLHKAHGWQNTFLGGVALVAGIVILVWLSRLTKRDRFESLSLALILGGALGNAWDRAQYAYVIDFLDFHLGNWHFAIFNLADAAISIGVFMLIVGWLFEKKE